MEITQDITQPWLDKSNLELWLQTPVDDVISKDADLKGDNYFSDLHRLLVKTKNGDKSLMVKCRLLDGPMAVSIKDTATFRKEQEMYHATLPRMEQILEKAFPDLLEPLAPKCFYSCKNFLVMEDLSVSGYKMLDRQKGLTLEQCRTVMRIIARFHAASISLHEQDRESMKEYQHSLFSEFSSNGSWNTHFQELTKLLAEELDTWEPASQWSAYAEKLRHMNILQRAKETSRTLETDFNVLMHGDLWVNNMLFRGNNILRVIDFQMTQFTSFALELHWFFASSPKMEVRINHTDALIQEYHDALCRAMLALGCQRRPMSIEELYEEYYRKSYYGLFVLVGVVCVMTVDPNLGFDHNEALKGILPGRIMFSEYFKQAVKWAFPLLEKMGAFKDK